MKTTFKCMKSKRFPSSKFTTYKKIQPTSGPDTTTISLILTHIVGS